MWMCWSPLHPMPKISLFDMVNMQDELRDIFGRDVDLISKNGVENSRNYLRPKSILELAQVIDAANDAYLLDILELAKIALDYVFDKTVSILHRYSMSGAAVVRRIKMIGQVCQWVSDEDTRSQYPEIEWREMTGRKFTHP